MLAGSRRTNVAAWTLDIQKKVAKVHRTAATLTALQTKWLSTAPVIRKPSAVSVMMQKQEFTVMLVLNLAEHCFSKLVHSRLRFLYYFPFCRLEFFGCQAQTRAAPVRVKMEHL